MMRTVKPEKKIVFIVIDGLGDRPIKGKTPLSEANIENINEISKRSRLGMHTFNFISPGSAIAHWVLFGYEMERFPGRGIFEAMGCEREAVRKLIKEGYTYFRTNFGEVNKDLRVIDRRVVEEDVRSVEEIINRIGEKYGIEFFHTKGHRGILIVKRDIEFMDDVDPYKIGERVRLPKEGIIRNFLLEVHKELEDIRKSGKNIRTNFLLLRGFGKIIPIKSFEERYKVRAWGAANYPLYKGILRYIGFSEVRHLEDPEKIKSIIKNFEKYDFFFVHFKGCDYYGERGNFEGKKEYLENIDPYFSELIDLDAIILITGDHSTPWILKAHSGDPCPFLIYNPDVNGEGRKFDEFNCSKGFYGIINTKDLINLVINEAGGFRPAKEIIGRKALFRSQVTPP